MRRKDGEPIYKQPVRYLIFPPGQLRRFRPLAGSGHSHVALSYKNSAMKGTRQYEWRRTLCGLVYDTKTVRWQRLDVRRYYVYEPVEWERVTCAHCLKRRDKVV